MSTAFIFKTDVPFNNGMNKLNLIKKDHTLNFDLIARFLDFFKDQNIELSDLKVYIKFGYIVILKPIDRVWFDGKINEIKEYFAKPDPVFERTFNDPIQLRDIFNTEEAVKERYPKTTITSTNLNYVDCKISVYHTDDKTYDEDLYALILSFTIVKDWEEPNNLCSLQPYTLSLNN